MRNTEGPYYNKVLKKLFIRKAEVWGDCIYFLYMIIIVGII